MNKTVTDKIIAWVLNGYNYNQWFEDNKRKFIKKNNPKYYETLYVNTRNNK